MDQVDPVDARLGHLAQAKLLRVVGQLLGDRVQPTLIDLGQYRSYRLHLHALRRHIGLLS